MRAIDGHGHGGHEQLGIRAHVLLAAEGQTWSLRREGVPGLESEAEAADAGSSTASVRLLLLRRG